jgi:hypothetical protein
MCQYSISGHLENQEMLAAVTHKIKYSRNFSLTQQLIIQYNLNKRSAQWSIIGLARMED